MTSPIIHARNSLKRIPEGTERDHFIIHQAIDSSKIAFCDARHRAVFHHVEGVEYLVDRLHVSPDIYIDMTARAVGEQHVREDLGGKLAGASDWLTVLDATKTPKPISYDRGLETIIKKYGGNEDDYSSILCWLTNIYGCSLNQNAGLFRHHCFGCFDAEEFFGAEYTLYNSKRKIPTRYLVETWLYGTYGFVPTLKDWCSALPLRSWMNKTYTF